jgi:DNA repair protein RadC
MKNWNYFGSNNLTNSELLAIIIKTGTKDKSCLDIAREILNGNKNITKINDLEYLKSLSFSDLMKIKGIGRVKIIQIQALIELATRINSVNINNKTKISCPKDIFDLIKVYYIDKKQEIIKTILLDNSNKVLSIVTNGIGNSSKIQISIKEIFSEPIKQMASGIILVHNHPSGNLTPSKADINFTNVINDYSDIFNIKLLDHVIIGKNEYISLKEQGYFK